MLSWTYEPKSECHLDLTRPRPSKAEAMQRYNKEYRDNHSGYMTCGCGSVFKEISKYTHKNTAVHKKWLDTQKVEK